MKTQTNIAKEDLLVDILRRDEYRMDILHAIAKVSSEELWIAGGFVRNMVWDSLHNYKHRSELGDIDVFYFNKDKTDKKEEFELTEDLTKILPNVNWSVKNQARMHLHDNNIQYINLEDALTKFPETSSAIAVRLYNKDVIQIIAPFGLDDLFNLVIKPTPHCRQNSITYDKYLYRQKDRKWKIIWPLLQMEM